MAVKFIINGTLFDAATIQADFHGFQRALAAAHTSRIAPQCCCRDPAVGMVVFKRELFHLRRFPGGANEHSSDCRSHSMVEDGSIESPQTRTIRYPDSLFVKRHIIAPERATSNSTAKSRGGIAYSSLAVILETLWRSASLCRWSETYRALPWQRIAMMLHPAAQKISMGRVRLSDRLILLDERNHASIWDSAATPGTARRAIKIVVGPVKLVLQTKKDVCIALYQSERIWTNDPQCSIDFQLARDKADAINGAYVVAALAVYWDGNLRCQAWHFAPATKAWHLFDSFEQGTLYQRLVEGNRRFSIPIEATDNTPLAIVYDAANGPRAIVLDTGIAHHTIYPSWVWSPSRPLPSAIGAMA